MNNNIYIYLHHYIYTNIYIYLIEKIKKTNFLNLKLIKYLMKN
jgi:hypothetical protein